MREKAFTASTFYILARIRQVKNETYEVGQEWHEGCDYKCACSEKLEILCQPRCKAPPAVQQGLEKKCELRADPNDTCCKVSSVRS